MKIFMVGEAATHRVQLVAGLHDEIKAQTEIVALPREAAHSAEFDKDIGPDDVVISLRLRREKGALPPFRLLHVPGAGLDGIDFAALSDATTVCNVFEHEGPIAEFVMASILQWEIRLDHLRRSFSPETWSRLYRSRVPHGELRGKTVGIIGFGRIGRAIADRARPFGVRIVAVDAAVAEPTAEVLPPAALPRLLREADYVIVACPLSDATHGLIGEGELNLMKPSAVLVNVSRAEVVAEDALFHALQTERIKGASLDVWYRYPTGLSDDVRPSDHDFHALPNAVCTPHSCAWTRELMDRRYAFIARNIYALIKGQPLENVVRQRLC